MSNNNFKNKQDFLNAVENKILICDGAMGTSLQNLGFTENPDSLNLNEEDIKNVINVHLSFLRAGSDIIQTNTFGSNPAKLKSYGLISDIEKINTNAVAAAREAINTFRKESSDSKDLFIAGDIGPLGKLVEPSGEIKYSEAIDLFSQQIDVLIKNNVDFILIETIMDLHEALAAVEAVKKIDDDIPIACTLAFNKN
ncbi:MAG: homocysteine S-methyltransferase family protein, partial [Actinobacteria bacterium]|nr:homocysteine S-methyltransferase family protein [Actinomycetota bacterium]